MTNSSLSINQIYRHVQNNNNDLIKTILQFPIEQRPSIMKTLKKDFFGIFNLEIINKALSEPDLEFFKLMPVEDIAKWLMIGDVTYTLFNAHNFSNEHLEKIFGILPYDDLLKICKFTKPYRSQTLLANFLSDANAFKRVLSLVKSEHRLEILLLDKDQNEREKESPLFSALKYPLSLKYLLENLTPREREYAFGTSTSRSWSRMTFFKKAISYPESLVVIFGFISESQKIDLAAAFAKEYITKSANSTELLQIFELIPDENKFLIANELLQDDLNLNKLCKIFKGFEEFERFTLVEMSTNEVGILSLKEEISLENIKQLLELLPENDRFSFLKMPLEIKDKHFANVNSFLISKKMMFSQNDLPGSFVPDFIKITMYLSTQSKIKTHHYFSNESCKKLYNKIMKLNSFEQIKKTLLEYVDLNEKTHEAVEIMRLNFYPCNTAEQPVKTPR